LTDANFTSFRGKVELNSLAKAC